MDGEQRIKCALAAVILATVGACAGIKGRDDTSWLRASPRPYESDIPLPEGFRLADQSSEDWTSGSIRYLRHRYRGRADKYAIRRFFRDQMPLVRWKAISESNVHGHYTMRFERGSELCTVAIRDGSSSLSGGAAVDVIISPIER